MIVMLIDLVRIVGSALTILIFIRVVLSWFSSSSPNALTGFVHRVTEPLLRPVRSLLPAMGGIDFSPILVLVGIQIVENLVVRLLIGMANRGMG